MVERYFSWLWNENLPPSKKEVGDKSVRFNLFGQSYNYEVGKGALLCLWYLENPEIPGISCIALLTACLDSQQQLWIEAEVQQKSKSLVEVLLRCRMFHNGFCCWCKMYSGYVFLHGNPSHKYGAFTLEGCYATDQGTLPTVVGLEKNWDEKGDKYIAFSHPGSGLDKSQC